MVKRMEVLSRTQRDVVDEVSNFTNACRCILASRCIHAVHLSAVEVLKRMEVLSTTQSDVADAAFFTVILFLLPSKPQAALLAVHASNP